MSLLKPELPTLRDLEPSQDLGPMPTFEMVPKDLLRVDPRYQRGAASGRSRELIRKLVDGFQWARFSPIIVAEMDDHYAVVDGQHRAIAALLHPSVESVPCWVVAAADVQAQARVFLGVNRDRNQMQPLQIYKAQLAARDPDALQIDAVCRAAGITLAYHLQGSEGRLPPLQTQAVSTIRNLLFRHGEGPVKAALKALADAYPETPGQLRGQVIAAVVAVFVRHGKQVDRDRLAKVLADHDCEQLVEAARAMKNLLGGTTQAGMVEALVRAYDKGLAAEKRLGARQAAPTERSP